MEQYSVKGMSCAACQARVEKAVNKVPGVTSCAVSLLTNSMGVEGSASAADIIIAVDVPAGGAGVGGGGAGLEARHGDGAGGLVLREQARTQDRPVQVGGLQVPVGGDLGNGVNFRAFGKIRPDLPAYLFDCGLSRVPRRIVVERF